MPPGNYVPAVNLPGCISIGWFGFQPFFSRVFRSLFVWPLPRGFTGFRGLHLNLAQACLQLKAGAKGVPRWGGSGKGRVRRRMIQRRLGFYRAVFFLEIVNSFMLRDLGNWILLDATMLLLMK